MMRKRPEGRSRLKHGAIQNPAVSVDQIVRKELIPLAELFTKEMKWKVGLLNNLFILDKRLCTVAIEEKKTTI